ncbi:hypothetical protein B0H13DRAFT_2067878 [Mycena leptocephala]|nr:hypothetical protein B0H13DRAFT_2067878 [Mycena leptocephala]
MRVREHIAGRHGCCGVHVSAARSRSRSHSSTRSAPAHGRAHVATPSAQAGAHDPRRTRRWARWGGDGVILERVTKKEEIDLLLRLIHVHCVRAITALHPAIAVAVQLVLHMALLVPVHVHGCRPGLDVHGNGSGDGYACCARQSSAAAHRTPRRAAIMSGFDEVQSELATGLTRVEADMDDE